MNTELLKTLQGLLRTADGPFGRHPQTREQQSGRQTVRLNEPVWGTEAKPSVVALLRRMSPVAPLAGVAGDAGETLRLNLEVSLAMTERGGRHAVAGIPAMALLCTPPPHRPKGHFDIRDEAATRLGLDDAKAHALFDGPNWIGGARAWVTPDEAIEAIGHVLDGESDGHSIWRHLDRGPKLYRPYTLRPCREEGRDPHNDDGIHYGAERRTSPISRSQSGWRCLPVTARLMLCAERPIRNRKS